MESGRGLDALAQRSGLVAQQVLVGAHGDKQASLVHIVLGQDLVSGEDAGRLAGLEDAGDLIADLEQGLARLKP